MIIQEEKKKVVWVAPFQIVWEDEVQKLQKQKKRIQDIMDFIKEEWLDQDKEFMKEVYEAIEDGL
jgi:hypothetical protein